MRDKTEFTSGRQLYKFLVSKGAYRRYLSNSFKGNKKISKNLILYWLDTHQIATAFSWYGSLEGFDYWADLNLQWCQKVLRL